MPRFKLGDEVERTGTLVPPYMKRGVVVGVIPNKTGQDHFTQYEVDFGNNRTAILYETQLQPTKSTDD
jgi:hypothetical protein